MADLTAELESVSRRVGALLAADPFCARLAPPALRSAVELYPLRGGKRVRPAILLWTCAMAMGEDGPALHAAAAVEVFHNWTLVHDDLIDGDDFRRGEPSVHHKAAVEAARDGGLEWSRAAAWGRDVAILAGDAMQAWSYQLLLRSRSRGVSERAVEYLIARLAGEVCPDLIAGQALDVWLGQRPPDLARRSDVERMCRLKTGALLGFCAEAGAVIGLRSSPSDNSSARILREAFEDLGLAFQLRDDWLGLYGDPATLGKPVGSDLAAGKPTILMLDALERLRGEERAALARLLRGGKAGPEELSLARSLVTRSGAEAEVCGYAAALAYKAVSALRRFPDSHWRGLLLDLADHSVSRVK